MWLTVLKKKSVIQRTDIKFPHAALQCASSCQQKSQRRGEHLSAARLGFLPGILPSTVTHRNCFSRKKGKHKVILSAKYSPSHQQFVALRVPVVEARTRRHAHSILMHTHRIHRILWQRFTFSIAFFVRIEHFCFEGVFVFVTCCFHWALSSFGLESRYTCPYICATRWDGHLVSGPFLQQHNFLFCSLQA